MRIVHLFGPSRIHPIYFTKWILHRGGSCRKRNQNFHYTKDEIIVLRKVCSNIGLGNGQWIKVKRSRTLHPVLIIFFGNFLQLMLFLCLGKLKILLRTYKKVQFSIIFPVYEYWFMPIFCTYLIRVALAHDQACYLVPGLCVALHGRGMARSMMRKCHANEKIISRVQLYIFL